MTQLIIDVLDQESVILLCKLMLLMYGVLQAVECKFRRLTSNRLALRLHIVCHTYLGNTVMCTYQHLHIHDSNQMRYESSASLIKTNRSYRPVRMGYFLKDE